MGSSDGKRMNDREDLTKHPKIAVAQGRVNGKRGARKEKVSPTISPSCVLVMSVMISYIQLHQIPWSNVDFTSGFWSVHECLIDYIKQQHIAGLPAGSRPDRRNLSNFLRQWTARVGEELETHLKFERSKTCLDSVGWKLLMRTSVVEVGDDKLVRLRKI